MGTSARKRPPQGDFTVYSLVLWNSFVFRFTVIPHNLRTSNALTEELQLSENQGSGPGPWPTWLPPLCPIPATRFNPAPCEPGETGPPPSLPLSPAPPLKGGHFNAGAGRSSSYGGCQT
ncbi:hypothetical protein AAFF_G00075950 [Aldrovandia affinis]|uniref:Uncharacterized protein n=1 Tax=Aldrovandia affinis TaxID=143900 RepID=A0AAD7RY56_9TELE|nr:hypothetical protein AAFF_G00075950 [Aldrovandia affinis]